MVVLECASCRFQNGLHGHSGHENPSLVHNSYTEERSHGHPVSTAAPALPEGPVTSIIATSLKSHQLLVHSVPSAGCVTVAQRSAILSPSKRQSTKP